ncbi:hypothetical protein E1180_08265 [Roseibium denhamense]|uniref:Uncharacterized protein n=1 Tax=Roseibium denhamense TaxID=76305 RepID=A0ABY1PL75_9HYPH|nr:hypothetical protein [Roseibium denhamense]MTI05509.1 hypothetical protein [Roseibium denhamense]SMP35170.1 hypothetical protein SAMN06265374_3971 [Roseibium denhamense]
MYAETITELLAPENDNASPNEAVETSRAAKNTYIYVPGETDEETASADDVRLGAVFRLGEYSDLEESAHAAGQQAAYYPAQHVEDAGSTDRALHTADGGSQGILLACDGRVLIKSNEKMYVETEAFHQRANGPLSIESEGPMTLETTGAGAPVTIASAQDTVTVQSGPSKDIILDAGDGTGDLIENVATATRTINGNDFTVTKGATRTWREGSSTNFFWGANTNVSAGSGFFLSMGADIFIKPLMALSMTTLNVGITGASFSMTGKSVDLKDTVLEIRGIETKSKLAENRLNAIENNITDLQTASVDIQARATGLETLTTDIAALSTGNTSMLARVVNLL